jgi:Lon protease-like protein
MPLHIFEPRYRRMIEALPSDCPRFAIALLQGDWQADYNGSPEFATVMGMGEVVHCQRQKDGCFDILVRGIARVRCIEEIQSDAPYRTVRAEVLGDLAEPGDEATLARTLVTLRHFFATILSRVPGVDIAHASRLFEPSLPGSQVVDAITSALPVAPADKQALLEELRPVARAALLSTTLAEMVTRDFPEPDLGSVTPPEA